MTSNDGLRLPIVSSDGVLAAGVITPSRFSATTPLFAASMLQAGLVKFGPDLHVIPDLAVSIPTISPGGKTYIFTIRQDARYANGTHCRATDIAASWARALRDPNRSPLVWQDLGGIVGAAAVSDGRASTLSGVRVIRRLTVRIQLVRPDASFLEKLAFPVAAIDRMDHTGNMMGLGPWVLAHRTPEGNYLLLPRRHYYGDTMGLQSAEFVPVRNSGQAVQLYRKNAVDVAAVPGDLFADFQNHRDFRSSGSLDAYYALPPSGTGPSLAAELDRDELNRELAGPLVPLSTLVPPSVPDYVSSPPQVDAPPQTPIDVGKVWPDTPTNAAEVKLVHALNDQWKPTARGRQVPVIHRSFLLPDPGRWVSIALSQTSSTWFMRRLSKAQTLTDDPVSRMGDYGDLETWVLSQGYVIPLASGTIAFLVKPRVQGMQVTPLGIMPDNNSWPLVSVS